MNFNEAIEKFLTLVQEKIDAYYKANYPNLKPPMLETNDGQRFTKIVTVNSNGGRSVYGFVEIATGDIYMAATFKKPALNGARGSIYSEFNGLEAADTHGVIYKGSKSPFI